MAKINQYLKEVNPDFKLPGEEAATKMKAPKHDNNPKSGGNVSPQIEKCMKDKKEVNKAKEDERQEKTQSWGGGSHRSLVKLAARQGNIFRNGRKAKIWSF